MSSSKGVRVTWLGHATVLIQTAKGTNILIDPFIQANPKYPKGLALPKLDYILLTHGHFDHIADAAPTAAEHGATVVAIYELADYMSKKGVAKTMGMNMGGTVQLGDAAVTMVYARHSAAAQDEQGVHYAGVAVGYVLSLEGGPTIYHAGDTAVFGDMKLYGELYTPDVAILPIGGFFTMGVKEAAMAIKLIGPKLVLPIHVGTFPDMPKTETPEKLAEKAGASVQVACWRPGEPYLL